MRSKHQKVKREQARQQRFLKRLEFDDISKDLGWDEPPIVDDKPPSDVIFSSVMTTSAYTPIGGNHGNR